MIIGIAGYAQTGKDTFGQFLLELLPDYRRMAFADALKEMLKDVKEALGATKEEMRPLYVELGKLGRKKDPMFWIDQVAILHGGDNIVITDVRYANEAKWITEQGGCLFYMERKGFEPANDEEHRSFGELLSLYKPYMIYNNGSLEQLRAVAVTVVEALSNKTGAYRPYNAHELVDLVSQNAEVVYEGDKFTLYQASVTPRETVHIALVTKFTMDSNAYEVRLNQKELLEKCTHLDGRKCGVRVNA